MSTCRECTGKHNTSKTDISESQDEVNNDQSLSIVAVHHASSNVKKHRVLMATAIVKATHRNDSSVPIRVLFDSASEANFITQAAHNKLGLKQYRVSEIVTGLNKIENIIHNTCNVHVISKCSKFDINAQCLIVPKITKNLPSIEIDRDKLPIPSNLELADSDFYKISLTDMLIGAFFFDLLEAGKIELDKEPLIMQNTKFGWIVAGPMPSVAVEGSFAKRNAISALTCSLKFCDVLNENLEKFWKLENYDNDNTRTLSINERKCEQHFE